MHLLFQTMPSHAKFQLQHDSIVTFSLFCLFTFHYSCVALSDLLVSRQVGEVVESLPQLWELMLRVRDDVKVQ